MADAVKTVDVVCTQTCANGINGSAELFIEGVACKVEKLETFRGKFGLLLGQVALNPSKESVAILTCGEANGSGCETRKLTGICVAGRSLILHVTGEICENNAWLFFAAVLREKAAAAAERDSTSGKRQKLFGGRGLTQDLRGEEHLLTGPERAVYSCLKTQRRALDKGGSAKFEVVHSVAHGPAMAARNEVERDDDYSTDE